MSSVYIDDKFIKQNGNINCIVFKIFYMVELRHVVG